VLQNAVGITANALMLYPICYTRQRRDYSMVSVHCVSVSVTISQSVSQSVCLSAKFQKKVADKFS